MFSIPSQYIGILRNFSTRQVGFSVPGPLRFNTSYGLTQQFSRIKLADSSYMYKHYILCLSPCHNYQFLFPLKTRKLEFATVASVSSSTTVRRLCSTSAIRVERSDQASTTTINSKTKPNSKADSFDETSHFVSGNFSKPVGKWLLQTAFLTAVVICFGGYTRLTEAGLSMTTWNFIGSRYPSSTADWRKEFDQYKSTPEFIQVHSNMDLDDFKRIFFNEWFHRMLARSAGIYFVLGTLYFGIFKKCLKPAMARTIFGLLSLFVAQGFIGWWMVKSGFEERNEEYTVPRVSPYRLAIHLTMATILYLSLIYNGYKLLVPPSTIHLTAASCKAALAARKVAFFIFPIAPITFLSGAFVAGNDAGYQFNTWPKMLDRWIPDEVYEVPCMIRHLFENIAVVQFNHRMLAYLTVAANAAWFLYIRRLPLSPIPRKFGHLMAQTATLQALLGIFSVLYAVPVPLGVAHQALGLGVITATVLCGATLRVPIIK